MKKGVSFSVSESGEGVVFVDDVVLFEANTIGQLVIKWLQYFGNEGLEEMLATIDPVPNEPGDYISHEKSCAHTDRLSTEIEFYWKDSRGNIFALPDMSTRYLLNVLQFLKEHPGYSNSNAWVHIVRTELVKRQRG